MSGHKHRPTLFQKRIRTTNAYAIVRWHFRLAACAFLRVPHPTIYSSLCAHAFAWLFVYDVCMCVGFVRALCNIRNRTGAKANQSKSEAHARARSMTSRCADVRSSFVILSSLAPNTPPYTYHGPWQTPTPPRHHRATCSAFDVCRLCRGRPVRPSILCITICPFTRRCRAVRVWPRLRIRMVPAERVYKAHVYKHTSHFRLHTPLCRNPPRTAASVHILRRRRRHRRNRRPRFVSHHHLRRCRRRRPFSCWSDNSVQQPSVHHHPPYTQRRVRSAARVRGNSRSPRAYIIYIRHAYTHISTSRTHYAWTNTLTRVWVCVHVCVSNLLESSVCICARNEKRTTTTTTTLAAAAITA